MGGNREPARSHHSCWPEHTRCFPTMALPMGKAPAMKSAMKGTMKSMKANRVSKIAKGKLGRAQVLRGTKEKTLSGLTKDSLMKNKRGKIVSKKASAVGKRNYKNIEAWIEATVAARKVLQLKGFTAINGKTVQGKAIYVKAKALLASGGGAQDAQ